MKEAKDKEAKAAKPKKIKEVDENKPKTIRTAYQFFMVEAIAPFKEANPEMNQKDIMVRVYSELTVFLLYPTNRLPSYL